MADEQFVARAARQRRILILVLGLALVAACAVFAVRNTFYDLCSASFDRSAEAVARGYTTAVSTGDTGRIENCWVRPQYYNVEAGCSEICLSRSVGTQFSISDLRVGEEHTGEDGRSVLDVQVNATCADGEQESGVLVLDALSAQVPWKHWRVNESTVGGTVAEPWCR